MSLALEAIILGSHLHTSHFHKSWLWLKFSCNSWVLTEVPTFQSFRNLWNTIQCRLRCKNISGDHILQGDHVPELMTTGWKIANTYKIELTFRGSSLDIPHSVIAFSFSNLLQSMGIMGIKHGSIYVERRWYRLWRIAHRRNSSLFI